MLAVLDSNSRVRCHPFLADRSRAMNRVEAVVMSVWIRLGHNKLLGVSKQGLEKNHRGGRR